MWVFWCIGHCVVWVVPDILKDCSAFVFEDEFSFFMDWLCISLKPPAQQNGITSQNTRIFNSVTLRTSNPVWYDVTLYFRKALCCWWLRWLTLSVFYRDLLSTRESLDARSQHDNCTSKCGSGSYRQSAVCSRRIFRYGDEFGVVGGWCGCHWKWWHVLYNG